MFTINDDMSIYVTRGDVGFFAVTAEEDGIPYTFQPGDVVRIKVTAKKACEDVIFQKDFAVTEETKSVEILLTEEETKIGEVISKPVDYWYEIELNPFTNPQTIVGYDEDGAKIFKLFPEGRDLVPEVSEDDIPVVDSELSLTSERPVQNQAVAKAFVQISDEISRIKTESKIDDLTEVIDQIASLNTKIDVVARDMDTPMNYSIEGISWQNHAIDETTGNAIASTNKEVTSQMISIPEGYKVSVSGSSAVLYSYNPDTTYKKKLTTIPDGGSYKVTSDVSVRITITDGATITITKVNIAGKVVLLEEELGEQVAQNAEDIADTKERLELVAKVANAAYENSSSVEEATTVTYTPGWESGKIYSGDGTLTESSEYEETTEYIRLIPGSTITASGTPLRVYSYNVDNQMYIGHVIDMSDGDVYTVTEKMLVRITAGAEAVPFIEIPSLNSRVMELENNAVAEISETIVKFNADKDNQLSISYTKNTQNVKSGGITSENNKLYLNSKGLVKIRKTGTQTGAMLCDIELDDVIFKEVDFVPEAKKTVKLVAVDNNTFVQVPLVDNLGKGATYKLTADVTISSGTPAAIGVALYHTGLTNREHLSNIPIVGNKIEVDITINTYDDIDLLLFYAGPIGATSGNNITLSNVALQEVKTYSVEEFLQEMYEGMKTVSTLKAKIEDLSAQLDELTESVRSNSSSIYEHMVEISSLTDKVVALEESLNN